MWKTGKIKNMVVDIKDSLAMVQMRFNLESDQYFGTTELPFILGTTSLGYLLCVRMLMTKPTGLKTLHLQ